MGRGAACAAPAVASPIKTPRSPARALSNLLSFRRDPSTRRSPLYHTDAGVAVGAALRTGLLHNLRGAPAQDRNAVLSHPAHDVAMLSVFSGHGKHGLRLAELAATVVSRHMRRAIPALTGALPSTMTVSTPSSSSSSLTPPASPPAPARAASTSSSSSSAGSGPPSFHRPSRDLTMERVVDDAFVDANIAVDATLWSRNCGATATVVLVRRGRVVVGACGSPFVLVAARRNGRIVALHLLTDVHPAINEVERERVRQFGGVVRGAGSVSRPDGRCSVPYTRSLGDMDMRSVGVCQVPTIRTFDLAPRHSHIIVSSQPLWAGNDLKAPPHLVASVADCIDACVVDMAERLTKAAFGPSGPTHDATVLCARLR